MKALFPGSFDPITNGHVEIIRRGLRLFDEIVIGIGLNSQKTPMFPASLRHKWIQQAFADSTHIHVTTYTGLTVEFARQIGAQCILRGLRNAPDFEYERNIDLLNKSLAPEIETVYLISSPQTSYVSSTLVREVIRFGGNMEGLLPPHVIQDILQLRKQGSLLTT